MKMVIYTNRVLWIPYIIHLYHFTILTVLMSYDSQTHIKWGRISGCCQHVCLHLL